MASSPLSDAQRKVLTAICDAAFRDGGANLEQEILAAVPEPPENQKETRKSPFDEY